MHLQLSGFVDACVGAAAQDLCERVLREGALPASDSWCYLSAETCATGSLTESALQWCIAQSIFVEKQIGGGRGVQYTASGLDTVDTSYAFDTKRRICKLPAAGVPATELTTFDLISLLLDAGWECRVAPRRGRARQPQDPKHTPVPYTGQLECPKVWWLKMADATVRRSYLLALWLRHQGTIVKDVPHFMSVAFYDALITGKEPATKKRRVDELEFESAADAPVPLAGRVKRAAPKNHEARVPRRRLLLPVSGSELGVPAEGPVMAEVVISDEPDLVDVNEGPAADDDGESAAEDELVGVGEDAAEVEEQPQPSDEPEVPQTLSPNPRPWFCAQSLPETLTILTLPPKSPQAKPPLSVFSGGSTVVVSN